MQTPLIESPTTAIANADPLTADTIRQAVAEIERLSDADIAGEKRGPVLPQRRRRPKTRRDKCRARRARRGR